MAAKMPSSVIAGIDIGTTKVIVLVGQKNAQGELEILGQGSCPCRGLKRGVVVDIAATSEAIQKAVAMAEADANLPIKAACVGIAGSHIKSLNSHGIVAIRNQEVSQADITRVVEAARAVAIPADQQILHILPQEFYIDNQEGIQEPLGMSGVRLEAKVHIVTSAVSAAQNLVKCVENQKIIVNEVILEQLASSYAVLSPDEKELGVCLIDIGGGTTDIAVLMNGAVRHSAVIPIAGDQVTNDVAIALRTTTSAAEQVKLSYGALADRGQGHQTFSVPSMDGEQEQSVSVAKLIEIVSARYEELFTYVWSELKRHGLHDAIPAGIVMTGGGAQVRFGQEMASKIFGQNVRVASPLVAEEYGFDGTYSTSVGLMLYGLDAASAGGISSTSGQGWWKKVRHWAKVNL